VRRLALLALPLLALAPAGCGGDDRPATPQRAVRLDVREPRDTATVSGERVRVAGRVVPASAQVYVLGQPVAVEQGAFSVEVPLEEGANVVDVAAAAVGRRAVSTAVRVVREVPVEIPDVEGEDHDSAVERLEALGLRVQTRRRGGLLNEILPGGADVCRIEPEAGTRVRPGTTVTLVVARFC
jgi:hypothetical protein